MLFALAVRCVHSDPSECAIAMADPVELAFAYGCAGVVVPEESYAQYPAQSTSEARADYDDHGA